MRIIIGLGMLMFFTSCDDFFEEQEVYGFYTPVNYKNNFDTIHLMPNNFYHRKVYDKNKKLLLEKNGKWSMENSSRIIIHDFYLNLDDDLIRFPDNVNENGMVINTYFETSNKTIQFCIGYYVDQNCYRKIK